MKKIILITMFVLILITQVTAVKITEIMYNPRGTDNNKEFIEVEGTNNLSNYIIGDLMQNDTLTLLSFNNMSNFSLIVEEGFNSTDINASIYSAGATIGDNLDNEGDTIFLYFNNTLVDQIQFTNEFANGNGHSLELSNNNWQESISEGGSPGEINRINTNECNIELSLETDKEIYQKNETVNFRNMISDEDHNYIISYYITDLFNNFIKYPTNTTNTKEKSFTPYIFESEQVFIIHNELIQIDCKNINNKTKSNRTIIIQGEKIKESSIKILDDIKPVKFGETIWLDLSIYKGNSSKDVVHAYVEKDDKIITKKSKIDLETNYQEYKFSIPINLPFNCNSDMESGIYSAVADGLDLKEKIEFQVEGILDICTISNKTTKEGELSIELISYPEEIELNKELKINLEINNEKETKQNIEIYSYIYSGPVSLSGERESNKQILGVEPKQKLTLELTNLITESKNNTKLKIKYLVNDRKGEITVPIKIKQEEIKEEAAVEQYTNQERLKPQEESLNSITANTIYESSNEVSKRYGIYIFIGILILIIVVLVLKNGNNNKDNNRDRRISADARGRDTAEDDRKHQAGQGDKINRRARRKSNPD